MENKRSKSTSAQLSYLVGHMEKNPWMASGVSQNLQGRAKLDSEWLNLSEKLNSLGGPIKSAAKWKQVWRDFKNNTKKKISHNMREFRGYGAGSTGNGPPTIKDISEVEEKVLAVMGPVAVYGLEDVPCTEPSSPSMAPENSPSPPPEPLPEPTPLPLPEPTPKPQPAPTRKRKRVAPNIDSFDNKLLKIEEEK